MGGRGSFLVEQVAFYRALNFSTMWASSPTTAPARSSTGCTKWAWSRISAGMHLARRAELTWDNAQITHYGVRSDDTFLMKNAPGGGNTLGLGKYLMDSTI